MDSIQAKELIYTRLEVKYSLKGDDGWQVAFVSVGV